MIKPIRLLLLFLSMLSGILSAQTTYRITFVAGDGGAITGQREQTVAAGEAATAVTASPDFDMDFLEWKQDDGTSLSVNLSLVIDSVISDMTIEAVFIRKIIAAPVYNALLDLPDTLVINGLEDTARITGEQILLAEQMTTSGSDNNINIIWRDQNGIEYQPTEPNGAIWITPGLSSYYSVTITGLNNCHVSDTVFVRYQTSLDNKEKPDFKVWPNPGKVFTMDLTNVPTGPLSILLLDMNGKIVFKDRISRLGPDEHVSFTPNVANGIYLLKITGHSFKTQQKIVVQ